MTATRLLKGGTIVLVIAAGAVAIALLWRTKVPSGVAHPHVDPASYFSRAQLDRAARYDSIGRLLLLLAIAVELLVLAALTLRGRRLRRSVVVFAADDRAPGIARLDADPVPLEDAGSLVLGLLADEAAAGG
jgi:hypothetical protein